MKIIKTTAPFGIGNEVERLSTNEWAEFKNKALEVLELNNASELKPILKCYCENVLSIGVKMADRDYCFDVITFGYVSNEMTLSDIIEEIEEVKHFSFCICKGNEGIVWELEYNSINTEENEQ